MKFSTIFLTIASVATAMAAALPEPEVEIPGKLVSRDEFELAIRRCCWLPIKESYGKENLNLAAAYSKSSN
ncbi:uncharacterized protein FFUJ_06612 [Fusarium fujikuroi IMI 58289]|uniref:Uncharacterized protein n=1 Tax=Gibberella fujikuroi (strain CBS 195.34 / IMI 58289 / NRRL A-6831) TaxID=1279085 RepID=S0EDZ3_GIBF5|nr:uncharacterized protein FFUJ_06612 [Fusarium fujikuroi IMI 58289]KLO87828.1 uncharacterized protein LW93_12212 [Fusarium fujikuroi]KLP18541.1 uncharacterized protein LW94_12550 [Fusarium fujikuroi]CCT70623.1 uncharacterized protein FFUJ_06612 [Fusarium fujikuroi IMI 58289]